MMVTWCSLSSISSLVFCLAEKIGGANAVDVVKIVLASAISGAVGLNGPCLQVATDAFDLSAASSILSIASFEAGLQFGNSTHV